MVGVGQRVVVDRAIDVLATEVAVAEGKQFLARERHTARLAHLHCRRDAPALQKAVGEQRPVIRGHLREVAPEDAHRDVEEPVGEVAAGDHDLAVRVSSMCGPRCGPMCSRLVVGHRDPIVARAVPADLHRVGGGVAEGVCPG